MPEASLRGRECSVIVAVRLVSVMKVPPNQVVGVRGMWDRFVPAARCMLMADVVCAASVCFGAVVGIGRGQFDDVLVDVVLVYKVKVTVVEIVHVPFVIDRRMRAAIGVFVRMVVVPRVFHARSIHPRSRPAQSATRFAIRWSLSESWIPAEYCCAYRAPCLRPASLLISATPTPSFPAPRDSPPPFTLVSSHAPKMIMIRISADPIVSAKRQLSRRIATSSRLVVREVVKPQLAVSENQTPIPKSF